MPEREVPSPFAPTVTISPPSRKPEPHAARSVCAEQGPQLTNASMVSAGGAYPSFRNIIVPPTGECIGTSKRASRYTSKRLRTCSSRSHGVWLPPERTTSMHATLFQTQQRSITTSSNSSRGSDTIRRRGSTSPREMRR
eukprot:5020359-Pleurochrysis_carterae.AAC.2